ncbi:MAG: uroporphyrinogen decarboxylase family protein [Lachnospiraceae bacterium]|nr:uroporphyrinogen decarboxylase family protein [Lachnospiraceae bacterium]
MAKPNREQLILDVISRKNTSYLPSVVNFANAKKKMECAAYVGITDEDEYDEYLGNHVYFTYTTDDACSNGIDDKEKVALSMELGRSHVDERGFYVDPWGLTYNPEATSYFNYGHPLKDALDDESVWKNFKAPDLSAPGMMDLQFKYAEVDKEKHSGDQLVVVSGYNGIWEKTYELMEIENFMYTLMDEPDIIHHFFDIITDYKVEIAKETVKRGFKLGHHGDDLGTQVSTFFSEAVFVEFLKPRLKKLFDVYHDAGIPVQMHSCGMITPFIPHLIDIGLDVLEPVQPVMDHEFLKREYGNDLIFYGGVDTQGLLAFGTPEEVYEGTLREIDILGKNGGYIAGPAQEIMDNVSPANVDALVRAIRHARGEE